MVLPAEKQHAANHYPKTEQRVMPVQKPTANNST
jgi:hypothetical protein